jgi:hypothetical protein
MSALGASATSAMARVGALTTTGFRRRSPLLELDLLCNPQRVVDFDTEISDAALKFGVPK